MKKRNTVLILVMFVSIAVLMIFDRNRKTDIAESKDVNEEVTETTEEEIENKLELSQIRNICDLSAVECEFTNIAKSVKEPGTGIKHMGEKRRKFWIEYKVKVRISYDLNKVQMNQNGDEITINLPEPNVSSAIVKDSWNEDSYIIEKDNKIQKNPITAEDQTNAIKVSCDSIEDEVRNNTSLIASADQQARTLIENYINQIGKINGKDYKIIWGERQKSSSLNEAIGVEQLTEIE